MNIIDEYIEQEGRIKLTQTQFSKMISDYYKKNYKLNVVFDFLTVNYIYALDGVNSIPTKVNAFFPCLIKENAYVYFKTRNVVIPGIIKIDELNAEINKVLPPEIISITNEDIKNILNELRFSMPLYDCFYNESDNQLEYRVKVKRINK